ncbi:hypothetical protein [Streptomyces sp. NPDC058382]|uniref:Flp family type IVb pilin n=1 Tax=unclassified Streptomyces TaxID=2593676 RepID=UPI00362BBE61
MTPRDRGQTAVEYLGLIIVVATIVLAMTMSGVGGAIAGRLESQVCALVSAGCGSGGDGGDPGDGVVKRPGTNAKVVEPTTGLPPDVPDLAVTVTPGVTNPPGGTKPGMTPSPGLPDPPKDPRPAVSKGRVTPHPGVSKGRVTPQPGVSAPQKAPKPAVSKERGAP